MDRFPVIIPARGGSKGIKGKNIIDFCGKPLIQWSIEQAKQSHSVSEVYISTDDEEIAKVSEAVGAKIVWRPEELATDTATSEDAIIHAIHEIEKRESFESVIFLQATSPIRRAYDIDDAVAKYTYGGFDSLFSMAVLDDYCLWRKEDDELRSITYDYKNRGRRQEREPTYLENGSIYIFSKSLMIEKKNRLGDKIGMYEMPFECSYEIDEPKDVFVCEYFMKSVVLGNQ